MARAKKAAAKKLRPANQQQKRRQLRKLRLPKSVSNAEGKVKLQQKAVDQAQKKVAQVEGKLGKHRTKLETENAKLSKLRADTATKRDKAKAKPTAAKRAVETARGQDEHCFV